MKRFRARKLIVMVEEPHEKMLKLLARWPVLGSIEDYKADLITYNQNMQTVVEKFWPYNKNDIQYKPWKR